MTHNLERRGEIKIKSEMAKKCTNLQQRNIANKQWHIVDPGVVTEHINKWDK